MVFYMSLSRLCVYVYIYIISYNGVFQVGHDGLLHVSLSRLVHFGLHPADGRSGTQI